ncbi:MAG: PAS domain-containing protein [Pyrinomonadaceae bacterium]|nr:PAS domain-containing protein [Phycisphaerales bacterium]
MTKGTVSAVGEGKGVRRGLPIRLFAVVLALTVLLFAGLLAHAYWLSSSAKEFHRNDVRKMELVGTVVWLDELLTMSARLAATTGDVKWEERYNLYVPQLDAAIKELSTHTVNYLDTVATAQTDVANMRLVEMETRAFELVRAKKSAEAISVLFSPEYHAQKTIYADGMRVNMQSLRDSTLKQLSALEGRTTGAVATIVLAFIVSMGLWYFTLRMLRADLAARRKVESELIERKTVLGNVLANIPYSVFWKDRDLVFQGANDALAHRAGFTSGDELIGKCDFDLAASREDAEFYRRCDREVMERGEPLLGIEETQQRPDGSVTTLLTSKVPMRNTRGEVVGILGIFTDITERKQQELAVKQSERFLQATLDSLSTQIAIIDGEGTILAVNAAWKHFAQQTAGALIDVGSNYLSACTETASREEAEQISAGIRAVIAGKRDRYLHEYPIKVAGEQRWFSFGVNPFHADGPVRAVISNNDITAHKRAQAEREELHGQLMIASRQAGMAEVAVGVLHNVGNVLNSVNVSAALVHNRLSQSAVRDLMQLGCLVREKGEAFAEFIATDPRGRSFPPFLVEVAEQVQQEHVELLSEVETLTKNVEHIKQVVSMQQSYAGSSSLREPVSLAEIMEDAVRINYTAFERHHVLIERHYADLPPVEVDRHKIMQIMVNLLVNAKQAMSDVPPERRVMSLAIERGADGQVLMRVTDRGVGIVAGNLSRIFAHGFTTRRGGHGFGLHSSALAAKEMGGTLRVHSDGHDCGATFTLEVPVGPVICKEAA